MKNKIKNKRIFKFIAIILILNMSCLFVTATEALNLELSIKLNIDILADEEIFTETQVEIYKIAEIDENYCYSVLDEFSSYNIDISELETNSYALAQTLSAYIALDNIEPLFYSLTAEKEAVTEISELSFGLYLVQVANFEKDGEVYSVSPALISLPYKTDDNTFEYEIDMSMKVNVDTEEELSETSDKTIIKSWNDAQNEAIRPEYITVAILKNGEVYDTAVLNEANNWQFTWQDLDNYSNWQAIELNVSSNYTVLVENEGNIFMLTNTITSAAEQITTTTTVSDQETETETLPQTGVLRWPIAIFSAIGLFFIIIGVNSGRKTQGEADE